MFSERENTGEKSVLIRYEIMIDEATESWEVVKQVSTKTNFLRFFSTRTKLFLLTLFRAHNLSRHKLEKCEKKQRK